MIIKVKKDHNLFSLTKLMLSCLLLVISTVTMIGQEINIGSHDSIESSILNEKGRFMISLPKDYDGSGNSYSALYRLDGDLDLFIETVGVVNRLVYVEELMPDMIFVMIENTNRNRDMMPTKTSYFQLQPGSDNFKKFIEN